MKKSYLTYPGWLAIAALLVLSLSCSDDSTSPATGDRVIDSFPLALGNSWEYTLDQSIYVKREDTTISVSSTGRQSVRVTRTENIGGLESFGMQTTHMIDYLFSEGSDTVIEQRYFAPASDGRVLLKADEELYDPGNNFIPFSTNDNTPLYGTMIEVDGQDKFISLEMLGYFLSNSRGSLVRNRSNNATLLASDGVGSHDNAFVYTNDYIFLYDELYKGLRWTSVAGNSVDAIDISGRVTNILGELDGYEGPIAEVEQTNSLIGSNPMNSEQYAQRFYYKGGVGLVRAEISDPEFLIIVQYPDSSMELGIGTWTFTKSLVSHSIR